MWPNLEFRGKAVHIFHHLQDENHNKRSDIAKIAIEQAPRCLLGTDNKTICASDRTQPMEKATIEACGFVQNAWLHHSPNRTFTVQENWLSRQ
jgi:hypothetical protein